MATRPKIKVTSKVVVDRDFGFRRVMRFLTGKHRYVDVGVVGENSARDTGKLDNVDLGTIHEFGSEQGKVKIPERSFLRRTFDDKSMPLYALELRNRAMDCLPPVNKNWLAELDEFGRNALGDLLDVFDIELEPPLSPVTIEKKGHDTILVDSGALKESLDYKVRR